jgi:DNA-nicking Smr family endonuclease
MEVCGGARIIAAGIAVDMRRGTILELRFIPKGSTTMRDDRRSRPTTASDAAAGTDTRLFREAMHGVRPIRRAADRIGRPKPPARARFKRADELDVLAESLAPVLDPADLETGDELSFRRDHVPETVLRRLRRGAYAIDAAIDLHGLTAIEARVALGEFLAECLARGMRCIRVIHGKGRRSGPRGPVLRNVVNVWLRRSDCVLAFGSARPVDGGSGATCVLLDSQRVVRRR